MTKNSKPDLSRAGGGALVSALSRRTLLKMGGAAAVGLSVVWKTPVLAQPATPEATPAVPSASHLANFYATPLANIIFGDASQDVDNYLSIDGDGAVTLRVGLVEFGQGIETGFMQLVAEELEVPFDSVKTIMGNTVETTFNLGTFGSLSTRLTGPIIRGAAAQMREWLLDLGAAELGVDRGAVLARNGSVVVAADPNRSVSYAELAAGQRAQRTVAPDVPLKDPATYTIVGQPIPRIGARSKVTGELQFGIDAAMDGMLYAKIVRPPALGARLQSIDFSDAEQAPGFAGSFRDGDFAAVLGTRFEWAETALAAVKAQWSAVETGQTSDNIHELLRASADGGSPIPAAPAAASATPSPVSSASPAAPIAKPLNLTFKDQYVQHAPIEPKACLVNVGLDGVDVWTSTQSPFAVQSAVATQLGVDPATVRVWPLASGGAFGGKIIPRQEVEAAVLSAYFGKPIKIMWSREEEFQYAQFRPPMVIDVKTGLAADNTIASWQYDFYAAAYYPEDAAAWTDAGSAWTSDVTESYAVPHARTTFYRSKSPLPPYFWRVNGASTHTFAREVTINHLAEMAGMDPVAFRLALTENPRLAAVIQKVVTQSGWTPGIGSTGQGLGMAAVFNDGTFVAEVAKVAVDSATGVITVERVDCVIDCGLIVNPEGVRHQVEGAIVMACSPTLKEAVEFSNGKVTNPTFGQYNPLRLNEAPREIVVDFVEDKAHPMGGVGEPAVAPVPAAIANAVHDAVGIRLYEVPFTPDRVLAAFEVGATLGGWNRAALERSDPLGHRKGAHR
jgi:nicotinate dehydrogenase subunit B